MKFLYKTMYSALLMGAMGLNATAQQQLPNVGFEEAWSPCEPWTSNGNSSTKGDNPTGWCISHVIGINGVGATEVGSKDTGYNSESAVKLTNSPNSTLKSQTVPGYMTLGKTWSTSVFGKENDGGSFDGIEFTGRPEKLEFMYKHTSTTGEKATVVAYLWKGHWTQKDVPGNIGMGATQIKKTDMIDRDRCVLQMDMTGLKGGEVIPSEDAELIAVINVEISDENVARSEDSTTDEWKKFSAKFDYKSDATPEKMNVILAAGNYFGGATAVKQGTTLTVDNVRVIYPATTIDGFLDIKMNNSELVSDLAATVEIAPTGENECIFTLPNFTFLGTNFGSIVVDNVKVTTAANGVKEYSGSVKDLTLKPEDASADDTPIIADVTLSGTTQGDKANLNIDVLWTNGFDENGTPIAVTFRTTTLPDAPDNTPTGITDITVDNIDNSNAPVEFFNLQGVRVAADNMTPGIYVRRQGSKVSKVLVK